MQIGVSARTPEPGLGQLKLFVSNSKHKLHLSINWINNYLKLLVYKKEQLSRATSTTNILVEFLFWMLIN